MLFSVLIACGLLYRGMLSPAISPRCINNNSNYSHSNQSVAPASRGLSREQIDRHLKSHIDCVAKKNIYAHKHTRRCDRGGQIVSLGRKIDVNGIGRLRKRRGCSWIAVLSTTVTAFFMCCHHL